MKLLESAIQCNYIQWLKLQYPKVWGVTCAFVNGGARTASYGARLKREGMKPGMPDVGVFFPQGQNHGLFIEFKAKRGKTTLIQQEMLVKLEEQGYKCCVCYSLEEAIKETREYLRFPRQFSFDLPSEPLFSQPVQPSDSVTCD